MRASVRGILTALGTAFAVYLAARSLVWAGGTVNHPLLALITTAFYLVVVAICLFVDGTPLRGASAGPADGDSLLTAGERGPTRLPAWVCAVALVATVLVPNGAAAALSVDSRTTSFGTWYVGAIGLLMIIVMVRRRPWIAWIGIAALAVSTSLWLGPLAALTLGLIGSSMWVLAAQLLLLSMDRAALDAARLSELQRAASAWRAAQQGRQRERRIQVQRALAVAGPILSRAIEQGGLLDEHERTEARIAEGQLRDELRGARLLDDGVRAELDAARRRGATVSVLDEGGLEDLSDEELEHIRSELAAAVHEAVSHRLYIRASTHPEIAVTVVGRSPSSTPSDDDSVDLWHEIPRPRRG
ncbi:hypothetical protein ET475_11720 [Microbacterium protaetiae]|uniref:Uncharacterized protein n=1 Tax=Microbacterium protaetiae TaxID=2509458 RepID=A0A4P6EE74_9MICO|nr:hypothetical protein [Microbacterium protaetiae]QAY60592.1 hypothetical protein ET475_11720 [Microbacterium protaetiae]